MEKEETGDLQEGKARFALFVRQSTLDEVNKWYKLDNCSRKSEFIEKAILFYIGYISAESGQEYFPKILTSTLKSIVDESDNRISRIIFKLAVELAVTMNIVAATNNISREQIRDLRATCVSEVKRTNGSYSLLDAYEMQKG